MFSLASRCPNCGHSRTSKAHRLANCAAKNKARFAGVEPVRWLKSDVRPDKIEHKNIWFPGARVR